MRISVLYSAGCPNWCDAGVRFRAALEQVGETATGLEFVEVRTDAEAAALRFAGSPTFMVDGVDLFDASIRAARLTCRLYVAASGGVAGLPDVGDLVAALREKVHT